MIYLIRQKTIKHLFCCLLILPVKNILAQSPYHITHIEGTKVVNGISVTVTHKGKIAILGDLDYCNGETGPYYFGYEDKAYSSGFGSYTFQFSPPVSEITINFTGLSADEGLMEEIQVFINGAHYDIPSPGSKINCEEMAVLTPKGNIRPCRGCSISGWKGTLITGPVSSFTVIDTILAGDPAGVLIALYIGDPTEEDTTEYLTINKIKTSDIAAGKSLIIQSTQLSNATYNLLNELGVALPLDYQIVDYEHILIIGKQLKTGYYNLEIIRDGQIENHKIIIE